MLKLFFTLAFAFSALAEDLTIKWDAPPKKSDIVGYYFILESASGLSLKTDIGLSTSHKFSVLEDRWYQIKIVPYSRNKTEGEPSNVIKYKTNQKLVKLNLTKPNISLGK